MSNTLKKFLIIFSIGLNIGFIAIAGYATVCDKTGHRPKKTPALRHMELFDRMNLDKKTRAQIDTQVASYLESIMELKKQRQKTRLHLFSLLKEAEKPDRVELEKMLHELKELEQNREDVKFEHLLKVKEILPPEQADFFFQTIMDKVRKH